MIYKCEDCINNKNCIEKQKGYKKLCSEVEKLDKKLYFTAYYSLSLKCDYFVKDNSKEIGECKSNILSVEEEKE